jgi:tyrosyl-tRNA synthetase
LFTDIPLARINEYSKLEGSNLNVVKRILADEATSLLHGKESLPVIHSTVDSLFIAKNSEDLSSIPLTVLSVQDLHKEDENSDYHISVADLLVKSSLTNSKSEGRRLIKAGGIKVNDVKVNEEYKMVCKKDFDKEGKIRIASGKKKFVLVQWPSGVDL